MGTKIAKAQHSCAPPPEPDHCCFWLGHQRGRAVHVAATLGGHTRFTLRLSAAERARQSRIMYMSRPGMRSRSMALPIKAEAMT